jgi:hypothetical protein
MQQLLLKLCGAIAFFFLTTGSSAQNVGIGTNNPQQKLHVQGNTYIKDSLGIRITRPLATLDVNGTVLFRGNNNNSFDDSIRAAVEFFTGRGLANNVPFRNTKSDIAFNFGGPGGGFRHFLITRHSTSLNAAQNAIDFYINKSSVDTGSFAPDSGNVRALSVTDAGVYISDKLAIGASTTPNERFYVNGNAKVETDFLVGGNSILNNRVNVLDRLAIGTSSGPTERFYVNGNAKVETDFLVGGKLIALDSITIKAIVQEAIQPPAFQNGWINHGGGFTDAGFWKDKEGLVHIQGLIKNGGTALNTILFTLPLGYRPPDRQIYTVLSNNIVSRIDILDNGDVIITSAASSLWLNLTGIYFRVN